MPTCKNNIPSSLTPYQFMELIGPQLFIRVLEWMDDKNYTVDPTPYHKGIIFATILYTHPRYNSHIKDNLQAICKYIKARCLNLHHPNYLFLNGFIVGSKEQLGIILDSDIPLLTNKVNDYE